MSPVRTPACRLWSIRKEKGLATSYFPALLNAVSSPRRPFTVVFGMGTGVTSSLKSPVQKMDKCTGRLQERAECAPAAHTFRGVPSRPSCGVACTAVIHAAPVGAALIRAVLRPQLSISRVSADALWDFGMGPADSA